MAKHNIALIFDFDDTLVPDSTTALLKSRGIDTDHFWKVEAKSLIKDGWDPILAYLKLILDLTVKDDRFRGLTNQDLRDFGASLTPYSGLQSFLRDMKKEAETEYSQHDIGLEYYVVSSGLEEIIKGCTKISRHLSGFWGCRLASDEPGGPVKYIKRSINFTEKTRYLFEINKGLLKSETDKNPLLVNKNVKEKDRRVPLENMIYVGDGLFNLSRGYQPA